MSLYKANDIFISNKTAVNVSKGEAIYLTYTVDSISSDESGQHGIVVTQDRTDLYPYDKKGVLQYRYDSVLLTPGELRRVAGYQYANGVNRLCHHLIPYSERRVRI